MKIKTDQAILLSRDQITQKVANFWNQITEGWRMVWGVHIHHGYYENDYLCTLSICFDPHRKIIDKFF